MQIDQGLGGNLDAAIFCRAQDSPVKPRRNRVHLRPLVDTKAGQPASPKPPWSIRAKMKGAVQEGVKRNGLILGFAQGAGGHAKLRAKGAREGRWAGESGAQGNIGQGMASVGDHPARGLQAQGYAVSCGCGLQGGAKQRL